MKNKLQFRDGFTVEVDLFGKVEGWENLGYLNSLPQEELNALSLRTKGKKEYRTEWRRDVDLFLCPEERVTFLIDSSG